MKVNCLERLFGALTEIAQFFIQNPDLKHLVNHIKAVRVIRPLESDNFITNDFLLIYLLIIAGLEIGLGGA